jgi:hypothetical protein
MRRYARATWTGSTLHLRHSLKVCVFLFTAALEWQMNLGSSCRHPVVLFFR